jgi:hypothetical protein
LLNATLQGQGFSAHLSEEGILMASIEDEDAVGSISDSGPVAAILDETATLDSEVENKPLQATIKEG